MSKVTCMHMYVQNWGSRCKIHLFLIPELFTVHMSIYVSCAYYFLLLLKLKNKIGMNFIWALAKIQDNSETVCPLLILTQMFYFINMVVNDKCSPFPPGCSPKLWKQWHHRSREIICLFEKRCCWNMPYFHSCLCYLCGRVGAKRLTP